MKYYLEQQNGQEMIELKSKDPVFAYKEALDRLGYDLKSEIQKPLKFKCPKCGNTKIEYCENFSGRITNPVDAEGIIDFSDKYLDGETNFENFYCENCGREIHGKLIEKLIKLNELENYYDFDLED